MKKINFVNKPNTDTPVNDKNLNKMQDNIEDAINEKNIIFAQNSTGYTTTSTTAETVPLTQVTKIGDKLSMTTDGGIKIGEGVNYVKASGQITYQTPSTNQGRHSCYIYKNSAVMVNSVIRVVGTESYQSVQTPYVIMEVNEGDVIYLKARSQDASGAVIFGSGRTNCLLVEAIN